MLLAGCATLPSDDGVTRIGNLVTSGVPEIPESLTQRMLQYRSTRTARCACGSRANLS